MADREAIMEVATELASLQLDPINVVARSHLLVLWSRLGRYDPADLEPDKADAAADGEEADDASDPEEAG